MQLRVRSWCHTYHSFYFDSLSFLTSISTTFTAFKIGQKGVKNLITKEKVN
jgi:hypothetical protein